jgi:antitoxin component YwqK of YwqJK toxin-antitoxin module
MKKLTLLIAMLIAIGGCSNEISGDQLLYRDGLFYEVNSQTPFTGSSVWYYESGQLKIKANYRKGKRHGLSEWYYENGQLQRKLNWQYGYEDGPAERYLENGSKEP